MQAVCIHTTTQSWHCRTRSEELAPSHRSRLRLNKSLVMLRSWKLSSLAFASSRQPRSRWASARRSARLLPCAAAPAVLDAPVLQHLQIGTTVFLQPHSASAGLPSVLQHDLQALNPIFDLSAGLQLYNLIDQTDQLVAQQLTGLTPVSFAIVLGAGLLTSLSPCTLSVLPLTIGYIGGYTPEGGVGGGAGSSGLVARSLSFSCGLATTLALLGVASAFLGGAYGQIGGGLPIAVALLAILMGLNLLEVLPLALPSLDLDVRALRVPPTLQAYLAGLTFALAASPCSTPILATLLAYVGSTKDPVAGGALLLAYALGYVAPLLAAALFSGALAQLMAARRWSAWVTPASGVLLVAGGTYAMLSRVVPA